MASQFLGLAIGPGSPARVAPALHHAPAAGELWRVVCLAAPCPEGKELPQAKARKCPQKLLGRFGFRFFVCFVLLVSSVPGCLAAARANPFETQVFRPCRIFCWKVSAFLLPLLLVLDFLLLVFWVFSGSGVSPLFGPPP